MKHKIIYSEEKVFAGWPANHGAWQWDNELLVGFVRGKYGNYHGHNVGGELEFVQARSLDYGDTWAIESTGINERFKETDLRTPPKFNLNHSILRVRGSYDHGGDWIAREGGFWLSHGRGVLWDGPFKFEGYNFAPGYKNTSRTCVVGNDVYLSQAKELHWGSDEVLVLRHDGEKFNFMSVALPYVDSRVVMPAVVENNNEKIMVCRRRDKKCWIDSYVLKDGIDWEFSSFVGTTGKNNGNPPALITLDNKLICAYANRSMKAIIAHISDDNGRTWSKRTILRRGEKSDIGYPQLLKTETGLMCFYYWAEDDRSSIQSTEFEIDEIQ